MDADGWVASLLVCWSATISNQPSNQKFVKIRAIRGKTNPQSPVSNLQHVLPSPIWYNTPILCSANTHSLVSIVLGRRAGAEYRAAAILFTLLPTSA